MSHSTTIAETDAKIGRGWIKKALIAAAGARAYTTCLLLVPWWWVQAVLLVGAAVFIVVLTLNPLRRFIRMASACLGAAGAASRSAARKGCGEADKESSARPEND